jgi:hypothetical protein
MVTSLRMGTLGWPPPGSSCWWASCKERHHDDRLCYRGSAERGEVSGGGHLSGLLGALPPDHDDDHGRAHGNAAYRPGLWIWRRITPAAGAGGSRRPRLLTDPDALHHPDLLYVYGIGKVFSDEPSPGGERASRNPPSSTNRRWSRWEGARSTRSTLCRNTRSSSTARPSDEVFTPKAATRESCHWLRGN